jgi:hypothetical protein
MNWNTSQGQIVIPFVHSYCLLPDDFADGIARQLLWTNHESYSVDIIPPWFSMLLYHLGDEQ